jgi:3',5'-cyclic-AMP phosphodiesterase
VSGRPFLLLQLSDLHIGTAHGELDAAAALGAALDAVNALPDRPDAVLVSGDLTHEGTDEQYEIAHEMLMRLQMPTYVLPGNHDDRDRLRRHFGLAGGAGAPILEAVDLGPLRLVSLDSTRPGADGGQLDAERLAWLDRTLAEAPEQPTLLAMHHPPLLTGVAPWDEIGVPAAERKALGEVLARHRQVRRVVAGHMHRTIMAELAGCAVLAIPSTYLQGRLDFTGPEFVLQAEPPGFAIHALVEGEVISHVQSIEWARSAGA